MGHPPRNIPVDLPAPRIIAATPQGGRRLTIDALIAAGGDRELLADLHDRSEWYPTRQILEVRARFLRDREMWEARGLDEYNEQCEVVRQVLEQHTLTGHDYILHHSPNGSRHSSARRRSAAMGTIPGFPDLTIFAPFEINGREFSGLAIEMKKASWSWARGRSKDGPKRFDQQTGVLERLRRAGWVAEYARGAFEALGLFRVCYGFAGRG